MLKLINKEANDLSTEAYCMMGATLYNIAAAELMMYQVSDGLDKLKAKGTWFQAKKKHLNEAKKACESLLMHLDLATSEANERIYKHAKDKDKIEWASKTLQEAYHAAAIISVMFFAKSEGDPKIARNMIKALGNFKTKNPQMDIDAILDYFHYSKYIHE